jgi:ribonuclease PH
MNVVMTVTQSFIEIQGTAEGNVFNQQELLALLELAKKGTRLIIEEQKKALAEA